MTANTCIRLRSLVLLGLASGLSGCSLMHAQSRIDPRTVASYDPREASPERRGTVNERGEVDTLRGCFVSSYDDDANNGAVDLTCARFPGTPSDGPTAYALATNYPLPYSWARTPEETLRNPNPATPAAPARIAPAPPTPPPARRAASRRRATKPAAAPAPTAPAAPAVAAVDPVEAERRLYRNRLGGLLMKHSDDNCTASLGRAANNEAVTNATLNVLTTGLASVASIVTGQEAQRILSGGAAITSGTRDHVNAAVFRNVLVSAVSRAIGDERRTMARGINEGMGRPVAEYDADRMIRDINAYHQSCSFIRGLELVVRAVDRTAISDRSEQIRRYDEAIFFLETRLKDASAEDAAGLRTQRNALIEARNRLLVSADLPVGPPAPSAPAPPVPAPPSETSPPPTTE